MSKLKEWLANSDSIVFLCIFAVSFTITCAEVYLLPNVLGSLIEEWVQHGVFAFMFTFFGHLIAPAVCILVSTWIYKSYTRWK